MALVIWHIMNSSNNNNGMCVGREATVCSCCTLAYPFGVNSLACHWLGPPVQDKWQVEMGWPDIHWLARDQAGGSH
jgi:hypothetical protein